MSKFHGRAALGHLRRNAVAYLALTIALGGTSYAAVEIPRNSVGTNQIRANAVGPSELRAGSVRSSEIKDGELRLRDFKTGELPAGPQGPPGDLTGAEVGGDLTGTLPNPRLATQPAVRVEDDTQVELDSATGVLLDFDEVFDTAEMHPGNGRDDRIRVPRAGTYVLTGEVEWQPNDNGYRTLDLMQLKAGALIALGSSLVEPRHSPIQPTIQQVTAVVRLSEGDTVALQAGQASGVPLEIVRGTLSAAFVSP